MHNESQASELVYSAGEIQQAPHSRALGNWFNSFSAVMKHHWGAEVPALTCMCSFHVVKTNFFLIPPSILRCRYRVTTSTSNDSANDSGRRSSVYPSSYSSLQNLPAVQRYSTPCCSHLCFYVCYFVFKQPLSGIWRAFATLILSVKGRA